MLRWPSHSGARCVGTAGAVRIYNGPCSAAYNERHGLYGDNTSGGSIAYRGFKAAVNMATRSAAVDLAPQRITCVVVNPGCTLSSRHPSGGHQTR
jgi:NAD(P)-dependent dehydrogenase (short-subunit alcohol dehydrogenase family)